MKIGNTTLTALAAAALLVAAAPSRALVPAGVVTLDTTEYSVSYDDTTTFGSIAFTFGSGSTVGFGWRFSDTVNVSSASELAPASFRLPDFGVTPKSGYSVSSASGLASASFGLPNFEVTAKPGYSLSGPIEAFMGNLVFTEFGTAATSATVSGVLSATPVGGSAVSFTFTDVPLAKTYTGGSLLGYLSGTASTSYPAFSSIGLSDALLTLGAEVTSPSGFASVVAQPQNEFKISFVATPVPEGDTWTLLLSGLAMMGVVVRRRLRAV